MFEWHKKEKPFFTGIARGVGGFGFGGAAGGVVGGNSFSGTGGEVSAGVAPGNGYRYHYFKTPGSFTVSSTYSTVSSSTIDVLLVAGGGGGGDRSGGGGGAGGIAFGQFVPIPSSFAGISIPITVGNGGSRGSRGNNGQDTYFGSGPEPFLQRVEVPEGLIILGMEHQEVLVGELITDHQILILLAVQHNLQKIQENLG